MLHLCCRYDGLHEATSDLAAQYKAMEALMKAAAAERFLGFPQQRLPYKMLKSSGRCVALCTAMLRGS